MYYSKIISYITVSAVCGISLACSAANIQHVDCSKWNLVVDCSGSPNCNADFYFQQEASAISEYLGTHTASIPQAYQGQLTFLLRNGMAPVSISYRAMYMQNNPAGQRWLYDMLNWQQNPSNAAAWNAYQYIDISQPPAVCSLVIKYATTK